MGSFLVEDLLKEDPKKAEKPQQKLKKWHTAEIKRQRYTFSAAQVHCLEMVFVRNRYISPEKRLELARWLGLTEQQVKIWFQNRRYKAKLKMENDKTTELIQEFYHPHPPHQHWSVYPAFPFL
ncbi:unnamed protein product, partial [Mesorhabditis spiculigera]